MRTRAPFRQLRALLGLGGHELEARARVEGRKGGRREEPEGIGSTRCTKFTATKRISGGPISLGCVWPVSYQYILLHGTAGKEDSDIARRVHICARISKDQGGKQSQGTSRAMLFQGESTRGSTQ